MISIVLIFISTSVTKKEGSINYKKLSLTDVGIRLEKLVRGTIGKKTKQFSKTKLMFSTTPPRKSSGATTK